MSVQGLQMRRRDTPNRALAAIVIAPPSAAITPWPVVHVHMIDTDNIGPSPARVAALELCFYMMRRKQQGIA